MNPFLSIKGRLLIFALCISLLPIITITTIYYFHSRSALKFEIIEKLKAVAESRERHILSTMETKKVRTVDFSSDGFIRNSFERIVRGRDSKQDAVIRLNAYLKKNKLSLYSHGLLAIILVDKVGKVISSTDEKFVGKDFSGQDVFVQGIPKSYGETCVGQPGYSPDLNENCIFISAPIISKHGAKTLGVIINAYNLITLNEITTNYVGMGETGEVYLVNRDKIMLTESRFTHNLKENGVIKKRTSLELKVTNPKTGNLTLAVQQCLKGSDGYNDTGYLDYRGVSVIGYWTWLPYLNWGLIAEINIDEACHEVRKFFQETTLKNLRGLMHRQVGLVKMCMEGHKNNARAIALKPQTNNYAKGVVSVDEFVHALNYLEFIRDEYGYKGIFICDTGGVIRLSTEKNLVGMNVSGEDYFLEAKKQGVFVSNVRPSTTPIVNEFGKNERNVPTLFVSATIQDSGGNLAGVLVLRVDTMELNKLMQGTEVGESGETYLIDSEGIFITESRFIIDLKRKEMIKNRTALELKGINPKTGRLTKGIIECLSGTEGYDDTGYLDYRGVPVLGTWCWIPEYDWGVMVEIDLDEAFRKSSAFWGIKQYF